MYYAVTLKLNHL